VSNRTNSTLRGFILVLSVVAIICVIIHYNFRIHVIKYRDNRLDEEGNLKIGTQLSNIVSLYSTGLWVQLLVELFTHAVICPPTVDVTFAMQSLGSEIVYSYDGMVAVYSVFRLYTVIRLFEHYSHWTNERSKRVW
jgi:hypothetical protein